VSWSYSGYASRRGLKFVRIASAAPSDAEDGLPFQPVHPPYPYRAGHYTTGDDYSICSVTPTSRPAGIVGAISYYRYVPYFFTKRNYRAP
jgi:hypothetical protein